jgi:AcrR family transcriptional regulator
MVRAELILDATMGLIADSGVEGVNMRRVAKAAKAAVGSLYHFFPSRACLLQAVANRHARAIRELTARLSAMAARDWQQMSAQQTADCLIRGYADYGRRHPDCFLAKLYLPVPELEADFFALLMQILDARLPDVGKERRQNLAQAIHAILMGGINAASPHGQLRVACFLDELPFVLGAYLEGMEERFILQKGSMCG